MPEPSWNCLEGTGAAPEPRPPDGVIARDEAPARGFGVGVSARRLAPAPLRLGDVSAGTAGLRRRERDDLYMLMWKVSEERTWS
jgi:hypothetical protein